MKKENLLDVLEKELTKEIIEADFAIDWAPKKHQFEVLVLLFAENSQKEAIEDGEGVLSEEEVIEFEDSILFYTNDADNIQPDDYLATIKFDRKKGLSKEWIHEFAVYLNECLVEGQNNLIDFLLDESSEVFELTWNQVAFDKRLANIKSNTYIPYPKY